jgi:CheY-like chemotaxis protein
LLNRGRIIVNINTAKILVVDDDPGLLLPTITFLGKAGYKVLAASTGQEGLMAIRAHRPDVVLMDVGLPDISGVEACRQIKEDRNLKDIFVIPPQMPELHQNTRQMASIWGPMGS